MNHPTIGLALLTALACVHPAQAAERSVDQHQAADPNGTVEIINVAGSLNVSGWDRSEVAVSGQIGERIDRVELSGSGANTTVRVVGPSASHWSGDGSARLTIHVPEHSALNASVVSADLSVEGVSGAQHLRSVSGSIKSDGGGAARINTVDGGVQLSVSANTDAEVVTMSGDVTLKGAGGEVRVTTVSGGGTLTLGAVHSLRLRTVAGDFKIAARLDPAAAVEVQSVSGDVQLDLNGAAGAQFDVRSLSGTIHNCSGPQPVEAQYGPGSRLSFSNGDGKAQVRMTSTTGELELCAK
ncbi:MAG TPA: DUF4097 family beta strand repeat-containing protein [Steroidobacteraceae bacterium]|jgi:DUF4097 and DUF4098 domain-containing protein YvlB